MIDQQERTANEELLAVYRRSLAALLQQQERYRSSGYVPLIIINDIYNAREQIRLIKERLRSLGAHVEDQFDDGPSGGASIPCPYPGIRAFMVDDAHYFFGREQEIAQLLLRIDYQHFLFVIGPSGSGKSSLVRAGLVAEASKKQPGHYHVLEMRPGATPLVTLWQVFGVEWASGNSDGADVAPLLATLPASPKVLLLVDQFEEIFTQASRTTQDLFIDALRTLSRDEHYVIVAIMRADFYADLMVTTAWPLTQGQRIEIVPLAGAALRLAIEQPALAVGVRVEPALLERLLADAAQEPGVLPLVQETMRLLWEQMEERTLTLRAYEHLGGTERSGLSAALALMANRTMDDLDADGRKLARRIFLRLTQFGEGRADTRRQLPIATLRSAGDDPDQFNATLRHLTSSRLLTLSGDTEEDTCRVDIAHEALLRWDTLRSWIAERGVDEQVRRRLEAKADEWVRLGRGDVALLDATELREAAAWIAQPDSAELGSSDDLLRFVATSRQAVAPGWNGRGLFAMVAGGLTLAALLGLLSIVAGTWPIILQRALILIIGVAVAAAVGLTLLFHRADPLFGQRISHSIDQRRWARRLSGIAALLATVAWATLGWSKSAQEAYCTASPRSYQHAKLYYPTIAVDESAGSNGEAPVMSFFLSQLTFAPLVTDQEWSNCQSFFEYRLKLTAIDRPGEHGYAATLYPNQPQSPAAPVLLATGPQLRCSYLADLAIQIADSLQIQNSSDVDQWREPAAPASCAVILKAQQGLDALTSEHYDIAERVFLDVIQASKPRWPLAYQYLGVVYLRTGRNQEATDTFEHAVALLPRPFIKAHVPILITLAHAYYLQNKQQLAEQTLLAALAAAPLNGYAHLNLAAYYREWGDYTKSLEHLQAARIWVPKGAGYQVAFTRSVDENEGILNFKLKRFDLAISLLEQAYRRHETLKEPPYEHQLNGEAIEFYLSASYSANSQTALACQYWNVYNILPQSQRPDEQARRHEAQQITASLACAH